MHVETGLYKCTIGKQADMIPLSTAIICQSPRVCIYAHTHTLYTLQMQSSMFGLPLLELTEKSRREAPKNFIPIRT